MIDEIADVGDAGQPTDRAQQHGCGVTPNSDQMVTSFPSKSEIALNLSTDGNFVTFMGYTRRSTPSTCRTANTPG